MKLDIPEYDAGENYVATDGIYASELDALDACELLVGGIYDAVNEYATYDGYDFDLDAALENSDYYVCEYEVTDGSCWFNALVDYGIELFGEGDDPYKLNAKRDKAN
jgi:hypothetical protein